MLHGQQTTPVVHAADRRKYTWITRGKIRGHSQKVILWWGSWLSWDIIAKPGNAFTIWPLRYVVETFNVYRYFFPLIFVRVYLRGNLLRYPLLCFPLLCLKKLVFSLAILELQLCPMLNISLQNVTIYLQSRQWNSQPPAVRLSSAQFWPSACMEWGKRTSTLSSFYR